MPDDSPDSPQSPTPAPAVTAAPRARHCSGGTRAMAGAVVLLLIVGAWVVYGRAIHAPFIFDDHNSILANPSITSLWPLVGDDAWRGPLNAPPQFCTAGRPLVNFTLALNYRYGRLDPAGYHVVNIIIHVLSGLLLWEIVRRTLELPFFGGRFAGASSGLALAISLIWAMHPLQTEAVVYVTQRTELLVSFCYLATLYASLRYWQAEATPRRIAWLLVATLACAAGMGSKEIMVSAPVIVLAYERTFISGSFVRALRNSWPLYLCLALTWILLLALNIGGPRSHSTGYRSGIPAYVWWLTETRVLLLYLRLAVWPWPLAIHYEFNYFHFLSEAWPWVLLTLAIAIVTAILFLRRTAAGFALVFFFAILSPTLMVPVITEIAAERRMYLPLAALIALAVTLFYRVVQGTTPTSTGNGTVAPSARAPLVITIAVACMIAALGALVSGRRAAIYNQPLELWQNALAQQPNSTLVRINLGMLLCQMGRTAESIPMFEEALRLKPDAANAANDLGMALINVGRSADAIKPLERALEIEPDYPEAHNNLGLALANIGRNQESIDHLQRAVELRPNCVESETNLGLAMARQGQSAAVVEHLENALRVRPELLMAYRPLVAAYLQLNLPDKAINVAQRAVVHARAQGDAQLAAQVSAWLAEHGASVPQP